MFHARGSPAGGRRGHDQRVASRTATPPRRRSILDFPHRGGAHCGSASIRDLLEFHGLGYGGGPPSEALAFGLAGGLDVLFDASSPFQLPFYLGGRSAVMEIEFADHIGATVDFRRSDDAGEAWSWIRDELDAGHPAMLWADMHELDYMDVVFHHTHHTIVIAGYDTGDGLARVADYEFDELQSCSLDSLARARASDHFPEPCHHSTFVTRFPDELPPPREAIASAMRTAVRNMRSSQIVTPEGLDPDDVPEVRDYLRGLPALERFAQEYEGWPDRYGDALGATLKALRFFILRAGTGGALFRSLQADFLDEAVALLRDPALERIAAHYRRLAESWVELAQTVRATDPRRSHAAGAEVLGRIVSAERAGVDLLEEWVA